MTKFFRWIIPLAILLLLSFTGLSAAENRPDDCFSSKQISATFDGQVLNARLWVAADGQRAELRFLSLDAEPFHADLVALIFPQAHHVLECRLQEEKVLSGSFGYRWANSQIESKVSCSLDFNALEALQNASLVEVRLGSRDGAIKGWRLSNSQVRRLQTPRMKIL